MACRPPPHVPRHLLKSSGRQPMPTVLHAFLQCIDLKLPSFHEGSDVKLARGRECGIRRLRRYGPDSLRLLAFASTGRARLTRVWSFPLLSIDWRWLRCHFIRPVFGRCSSTGISRSGKRVWKCLFQMTRSSAMSHAFGLAGEISAETGKRPGRYCIISMRSRGTFNKKHNVSLIRYVSFYFSKLPRPPHQPADTAFPSLLSS
jgi:hypothetical protein